MIRRKVPQRTDRLRPAPTRRAGTVRVKRCGKSAPRCWRQERHGKPHPEQGQVGGRIVRPSVPRNAHLQVGRTDGWPHNRTRATDRWTEPRLQADSPSHPAEHTRPTTVTSVTASVSREMILRRARRGVSGCVASPDRLRGPADRVPRHDCRRRVRTARVEQRRPRQRARTPWTKAAWLAASALLWASRPTRSFVWARLARLTLRRCAQATASASATPRKRSAAPTLRSSTLTRSTFPAARRHEQ